MRRLIAISIVLTLGLAGVFYAFPYQFATGAELYQELKRLEGTGSVL